MRDVIRENEGGVLEKTQHTNITNTFNLIKVVTLGPSYRIEILL